MIVCKSSSEVGRMRTANQLVADVLCELKTMVEPGMTTNQLDTVAETRIRAVGAKPAFKGYQGYPSTICASVNDAVVHGIPSDEVLKDGDIISLDIGVVLDGYYGDSAVTIGVGSVSERASKLMTVTSEALERAIMKVQVDGRLSDIGHAVQQHVEAFGFSVVREFVGHGIGTQLHEEPQIPNYGEPGRGPQLLEGMVLAIEPMVNEGGPGVRVLDDGWTAVTRDGNLSAHFEHSIAVTADGPEILSRRREDVASVADEEKVDCSVSAGTARE